MSLQVGTLVGAPIRVNDSADTYPSAVANEILGGHMSVPDSTTMNAIPAARRQAGMLCYVTGEGNTYQLANDLVTWVLKWGSGGSTTGGGTGGSSGDTTLLSGNFGAWTPVGSPAAQMINTNFALSYKSDLISFPTRAITYIQGQFEILGSYAAPSLLLGTLPVFSQPAATIIKGFTCQNVQLQLTITTAGNITLSTKDGSNLPVQSGNTEPIYIDLFFNPYVATVTPTVYSYTRTQSFTRNNCGVGYTPSSVSYSQTYTSTISLAQATANAMADPNYTAAGQAYANGSGTCTINPAANANVVNNRIAGTQNVIFTQISNSTQWTLGGTLPGNTGSITVPTDTYTVTVQNQSSTAVNVQINGGFILATIPAYGSQVFAGPYSPTITVTLS